jgi:PAS domain S-box-containing protein
VSIARQDAGEGYQEKVRIVSLVGCVRSTSGSYAIGAIMLPGKGHTIMHLVTFTLRQRVTALRWTLPVLFGCLAVLFELGPGRSILTRSVATYIELDAAFYGLIIPIMAFATLTLLSRWLSDKEDAEKQARASEQRLISIMTASADAIVGVDQSGRIESWNRGAEQIFGIAAAELRGRPLAALFGGGASAEVEAHWLIQNVEQLGFLRGHETLCRDRLGREIAVELTATHLTDDSGQSLGLAVILRDITERKQRDLEIRRLNASLNARVLEQTQELAQKIEELAGKNSRLRDLDRMRSEFVSITSHQIRAPLTNMRGATERMQSDCSAMTPTCTRMFAILEQQIGRLERLVRDVLNVTRIEAGELVIDPEPISLLPVVEQVVEQTRARSTGCRFRIIHYPGLPLIFADRDRVAEVLSNLLDNAEKYSDPGANIEIRLRADETEVVLAVRDCGRGLRDGDLERVFEKFYRVDSSDSQSVYGYGLGLYVCRQLITAQKGRIWAEHAPGVGAVFSFALPIAY